MSYNLVQFRLLDMPCCKQQLCWVNPRLPNFCPECGKNVFAELKAGDCTVMDQPAVMKFEDKL